MIKEDRIRIIKAAMAASNITQEDIAKLTDSVRQNVSRIIKSKKCPPTCKIKAKLAQICGMKCTDLWIDEDKSQNKKDAAQ